MSFMGHVFTQLVYKVVDDGLGRSQAQTPDILA